MNSNRWVLFNTFLHKKHGLLVPDRNWTTRTVTTFKADFSTSESLNPSANSAVRNTAGSICMCQINMDFHAIVSQFHLCDYIETKLLSFGIHFFPGTVDDIFLMTSNNHTADDVNTVSSDTSVNYVAYDYSLQMAELQALHNEKPPYSRDCAFHLKIILWLET